MQRWGGLLVALLSACGADALHRQGRQRTPEVIAPTSDSIPPETPPPPTDPNPPPEDDPPAAECTDDVTTVHRPVDVIVVIDNSGSMGGEIEAVQAYLDSSFASALSASQLDYRVIMLSQYGEADSGGICIAAPLGGGACSPLPPRPLFTERYFHYSLRVRSHDAWCKVLESVESAVDDDFQLAPLGLGAWLRPTAFKAFLLFTDDGAGCNLDDGTRYDEESTVSLAETSARSFDTDLRARFPAHFSTSSAERNFVWHSIVGMAQSQAGPADPIDTTLANGARRPGLAYQALSRLSGGLRFSIEGEVGFAQIFENVAASVEQQTRVPCQ